MKVVLLFISSAVICANFVQADETSVSATDFDQTLDGAKEVGNAVANKAVAGYEAGKEYVSNKTIGEIAEDVADRAKEVGDVVADNAVAGYEAGKEYVSNKTIGEIGEDVADRAKKVGDVVANKAKDGYNATKVYIADVKNKVCGWIPVC